MLKMPKKISREDLEGKALKVVRNGNGAVVYIPKKWLGWLVRIKLLRRARK